MTVTLQRPSFFDGLAFVAGPMGEDDRRTWTAPCGCSVTRLYVRWHGGGGWAADERCHICDDHCQWCDSCDAQTWPHDECRCTGTD